MKRKIMFPILLLSTIISADNLTSDEIRSAYYSSYELESQERYTEASKALNPVAKEYPQGYTVNYRRGWLAYLNGHYADARKLYKIALTQFPSSLEIRKAIILIDVARKEWKEVEHQARAGRTIDYLNLDFAYWQSVSLRMQKEVESALKICNEISAVFPTNTNFLMELALCYNEKGETERVLAILESVFILDPYNQVAAALSRSLKEKK